jgi:hypothetical protein
LPEDVWRLLSEYLPYESLSSLGASGSPSMQSKLRQAVKSVNVVYDGIDRTFAVPNLGLRYPNLLNLVIKAHSNILSLTITLSFKPTLSEWPKTLRSLRIEDFKLPTPFPPDGCALEEFFPHLTSLTLPCIGSTNSLQFLEALPRALRRLEIGTQPSKEDFSIPGWHLRLPPHLETFLAPTIYTEFGSVDWLPPTITEWSTPGPMPLHIFELLPALQHLSSVSVTESKVKQDGGYHPIPSKLLSLSINLEKLCIEYFERRLFPVSLRALEVRCEPQDRILLGDLSETLPNLTSLKFRIVLYWSLAAKICVTKLPASLIHIDLGSVDLSGPRELLQSCTNLETLKVANCAADDHWPENISMLVKLRKISLRRVKDAVAHQMQKSLLQLPSLTSVSLPRSYWEKNTISSPLGYISIPFITKLSVPTIHLTDQTILPPQLQSLTADVLMAVNLPADALSPVLPPSLTHLQACIRFDGLPQPFLHRFANLPLQSLLLRTSSVTSPYLPLLPYLPKSLTRLEIPFKEKLTSDLISHFSGLNHLRSLDFFSHAPSTITLEDLVRLPPSLTVLRSHTQTVYKSEIVCSRMPGLVSFHSH